MNCMAHNFSPCFPQKKDICFINFPTFSYIIHTYNEQNQIYWSTILKLLAFLWNIISYDDESPRRKELACTFRHTLVSDANIAKGVFLPPLHLKICPIQHRPYCGSVPKGVKSQHSNNNLQLLLWKLAL